MWRRQVGRCIVRCGRFRALDDFLWWVIRRHAGEDPGPIARRDPGLLPVALNNAYGTALQVERAEETNELLLEFAAEA